MNRYIQDKFIARAVGSTATSAQDATSPLSHTNEKPSDVDRLVTQAVEAKKSINWHNVMLSARIGPARWERLETSDSAFRTFSRHTSQRFEVLAVGYVAGCIAEVLNVLRANTSEQLEQQLQGVYGDDFLDGEIVRRVDVSSNQNDFHAHDGSALVELTVKRQRFKRANWLAAHEDWCYVDAVYRNKSTMEKVMSTSNEHATTPTGSSATNAFHNVVCGYRLSAGNENQSSAPEPSNNEADRAPPPRVTEVTFYGKYQIPLQVGRSFMAIAGRRDWRRSGAASDKTIKQRLIKLAASTSRLTALVRRQRLGQQVLVDASRFFPAVNTLCTVCHCMLMVAKMCRVCGHGVCRDCSAKHERAKQPPGDQALVVTRIRVCTHCIERIDVADYSRLDASSLLGTHVVAEPDDAKSASEKLRDHLKDALLTTPSPVVKASVKKVVQYLLEDDMRSSCSSHSSSLSAPFVISSLTPDDQCLRALAMLEVDQVPADWVVLRSDEHRSYRLDTSGLGAVPTPVPDNEEERLQVVKLMNAPKLAKVMELEILCELAAREIGCAMTAITLIDRNDLFGVASNVDTLRHVRLPRTQTLCAHTMMEKRTPLIVAHPEADIRFSKFDSIRQIDARFYCAFPLLSECDQVIGTMCCFHVESLEISESQIANLEKLASTASRVMCIESCPTRDRTALAF